MNGRDAQIPDAPLEQLIQLLQSGDGSPISEDQLSGINEQQRRELAEIQAALNLLDLARPGDSQAAIESVARGLDATPVIGDRAGFGNTSTPQTIGHYEVLETVAQGGFGVVLKARDTRLERVVALKIPRLESLISSPDARERFAREARLVAMLGHPAIVPVYETGTDGPILFIATSFCNGGTLGQWFRDHKQNMTPDLAARVVARLAEGIQHAHARGVVHRDLKPGNVLLQFENEETAGIDSAVIAALRIADFGLAGFASGDQHLTQTGATIGTPAYMSPEQARGAVDEIGAGSDIYALGAILYELLTGKPPIVGESNLATMRAIETRLPQSPRRANPEVPRDLAAICLKCLEKNPCQRYTTAQQLQEDLAFFVAGRPVTARPVGKPAQWKRWCVRNPALATVLALLMASLVTGLALTTWQWQIAQANLVESNRQNDRAFGHLQRAEEAIDDMLTDAAESLRNVPHMMPLRERLLLRALDLQQEILDEEQDELASLRTAHAHRRIGKIQSELGKPESAVEQYTAALAVLNEISRDQLTEAEFLVEQGRLNRLLGHVQYTLQQSESQQAAQTAIAVLTAADFLNPDPGTRIELAGAYRLLGMSLQRERQGPEAIEAFQQSVQLLTSISEDQRGQETLAELSRAYNSLAIGQKAFGHMAAAAENYQAAIRVAETALQSAPEDVELKSRLATTALNLGNLKANQKDYQQACDYYELSAATFEQLIQDFPSVPRYLSLASMAANGTGIAWRRVDPPDFQRAVEQFQHSIDLLRDKESRFGLTAADRVELATLYANLGSVTGIELKDWPAGRQLQQVSVELGRELVAEFPERLYYWRSLSLSLGNLAVNMMKHGEPPGDVRELLQEAKSAGLTAWRGGRSNPLYRSNLQWQIRQLALVHAKMGDAESVRDLAHEWIEMDPDSADHHQFGISLLASMIDEVASQPNLDAEQQQFAADQMANWAMDLVVVAQTEGLIQSAELQTAAAIAPLRSYPRFRKITER